MLYPLFGVSGNLYVHCFNHQLMAWHTEQTINKEIHNKYAWNF